MDVQFTKYNLQSFELDADGVGVIFPFVCNKWSETSLELGEISLNSVKPHFVR